MCGIAGVIYRNPTTERSLGSDLLTLVRPLESRGPDSCGVALYRGDLAAHQVKLMLFIEQRLAEPGTGAALQQWLAQYAQGEAFEPIGSSHRLILSLNQANGHRTQISLRELRTALQDKFPQVTVMSTGQMLEIYKSVGSVQHLTQDYGLEKFAGSHGIGHTRMATESVVDTDHCHPFTAAEDLAVVHNGQISNYYRLRANLERAGAVFETANDSEAIGHYLRFQFLQGKSLEEALANLGKDFDGTYTILVATRDKVALARDKFAAKPAVIYESAEMVAIASEYRAFLNLPGFDANATIREPDAGEVNVWPVLNVAQTAPSMPEIVSGVGA
ncbi:hypothetical protein [Leptolyngbya sp. FACHB-261]|uniref:hypothetical protein n=1 Tax=Leptolyngbya sp. FACHB-261 TaxID=2692806 RepID=UPI001685FA40|nr:hypothetical protein [Leptolyngbya sp. FACHB-261]MBD2102554.1 hypothetical protein [Leptolyngbya sp. FACHB-261]